MIAPDQPGLDAESVQESIRRALVARRDTPRREMAAIAADLGTYIDLLLPAGRVAADRMWRGSIHWTLLSTRLDSIKRQAERGLGDDGPVDAENRLRQLAFDCQWLWTRYGPTH
ncbi:hypothetical protein QR77_32900 [Streptomyces sp. 150FB]|uniref:DUF6415 family natural product biosynthesis protein n=1 Tax=Streptomyces sp. 150FB TaxID=1576605 RepID=UPI000589510F|nr:DUF6415 family natural product biosynthesis protein [Streptomyces sp. 150FB]KIF77361.1 hypothetical protein QR77_32900 [Streptomyces sp. 150FB]